MRIAISGTHAAGKSTLAAELRRHLRSYETIEEPYHELTDEGHVFADEVSVDDVVAQLERSIVRFHTDGSDVLFDRCPADFLAYLVALDAADVARESIDAAYNALATLDLIVFVPIEQPDRIIAANERHRLRREVDILLREMLLEDSYGFGLPVVHVHGSVDARLRQVLGAIADRTSVNPHPTDG